MNNEPFYHVGTQTTKSWRCVLNNQRKNEAMTYARSNKYWVDVYLMKIDIVVKRYEVGQLGGPEPSDCISTHGEENESHVELKGLTRTLSRRETIMQGLEGTFIFVLKEFPCKQPNHDHNPQCQNPNSPPILLQRVYEFCAPPSYWTFLSQPL